MTTRSFVWAACALVCLWAFADGASVSFFTTSQCDGASAVFGENNPVLSISVTSGVCAVVNLPTQASRSLPFNVTLSCAQAAGNLTVTRGACGTGTPTDVSQCTPINSNGFTIYAKASCTAAVSPQQTCDALGRNPVCHATPKLPDELLTRYLNAPSQTACISPGGAGHAPTFMQFTLPVNGSLRGILLEHLCGSVSCGDVKRSAHWGCDVPGTRNFSIAVFVTADLTASGVYTPVFPQPRSSTFPSSSNEPNATFNVMCVAFVAIFFCFQRCVRVLRNFYMVDGVESTDGFLELTPDVDTQHVLVG